MSLRVVVEVAPKRAFASALDWPGWSRGGRTADEALETLLAYAPRYAAVARGAKIAFRPPATVRGIEVIERLKGGAGTEFGVPGAWARLEKEPIGLADMKRLVALLRAAWATFDVNAERAKGVKLTLGPRGGGRQPPKMVEHVREAEAAYVHQLGTRAPRDGSMAELRDAFAAALTARVAGEAVPNPNKVRRPWEPRYAVRRSAWHALDHAWEIEDRSTRRA
ncbi:MAG: hypothetical protein ACRDFY_06250 [Candidatus Limnocylindria bacterium]